MHKSDDHEATYVLAPLLGLAYMNLYKLYADAGGRCCGGRSRTRNKGGWTFVYHEGLGNRID